MLFNSYAFIFAFLPVSLGIYWFLQSRVSPHKCFAWLVAVSLFYYGWWDPRYLVLIGLSMLVNFELGQRLPHQSPRLKYATFLTGLTLNLSLLGYFKYAAFAVQSLNYITEFNLPVPHIVLPLAISFFTFQQIAYLVDAYRGVSEEHRFIDYCLFV